MQNIKNIEWGPFGEIFSKKVHNTKKAEKKLKGGHSSLLVLFRKAKHNIDKRKL